MLGVDLLRLGHGHSQSPSGGRPAPYTDNLTPPAEQQDTASGNTTHGGGGTDPAPRTGKDPGSEGLPKALTDLEDLFSTPDRPDLTAGIPPIPDELGPALDRATDWANDTYKDHLRVHLAPTHWALGKVRDGLGAASDELSYRNPRQAPIKFVLDTFQDETDMYREILKDPKDWWDNDASTLDKVGLAASIIPYGGAVAKIATKSTKEALDLIAKASRRSPSHPPAWVDDLDKVSGLKNSSDPLERGLGENAEHAQKLIEKHDVDKPEGVWRMGNGPRGLVVEALHGGNLPLGFKGVDRWETVDGVDRVVSTKTLDASKPTYDGKPSAIESKLNSYVRDLDKFERGEQTSKTGNYVQITSHDYDEKALEVIVRPDSMSSEDMKAVDRVRSRAEKQGIDVEVIEYP